MLRKFSVENFKNFQGKFVLIYLNQEIMLLIPTVFEMVLSIRQQFMVLTVSVNQILV